MGSTGNVDYIDSSMVDYAPYIVILPMLAFPIILLFGKLFNNNSTWKNTFKEGGIGADP